MPRLILYISWVRAHLTGTHVQIQTLTKHNWKIVDCVVSKQNNTRDRNKVQNTSCFESLLLDFSLTVKAAPHECVIRTNQP